MGYSHRLVRFTFDDDEAPVIDDTWHFVTQKTGSDMKLCSGEVFGIGEGSAVYEMKEVTRGGITCPMCLEEIRRMKAIKL